MVEHIPRLCEAGIDSFKVEGRMKTALYVATVARAYRRAIDDFWKGPEVFRENLEWYKEEIGKCTNREFTTGFFLRKTGQRRPYIRQQHLCEKLYLFRDRGVSGCQRPGLPGAEK